MDMESFILKNIETDEIAGISRALIDSPHLVFVVYDKNRVLFANNHALKLLGYSLGEIKKIHPLELLHEDYRHKFKPLLNQRIEGKLLTSIYNDVAFVNRYGKVVDLNFIAGSLTYNGKKAGFIIGIDITKSKLLSVLYHSLRDVNRIITTSSTENDMLHKVCSVLVNKYGLQAAVILKSDNNHALRPFCHYFSSEIESKSILGILSEHNIKNCAGYRAFTENKIEVVENVSECEYISDRNKDALKRSNILSLCSIPLEKHGKRYAVLSLYSNKLHYFTNASLIQIKEIQHDISFALDNIEEKHNSKTFYEAVRNSDWWFLITDEDARIIYINDAVEKISGYTRDELLGENPRIFKSGLHDEEFYKQIWNALTDNKIVDVVIANRKKDGTIFHIQDRIVPVSLPDGSKRFVAIGRDITKELKLISETEKLKYQDVLTDLLNLNGFVISAEKKIKSASKAALVIIDIFNFSYINRVYGFNIGDKLLREIGTRLKEEFPLVEDIARIGSDDFGLFIGTNCMENFPAIPAKITEMFNEPFHVENKNITISFNGGVALYPQDGLTVSELMEKASITLNRAKKKGENYILFYNPTSDEKINRYMFAEKLIERAVKESLFILHYQPYVHCWDRYIVGAETLTRIKEKDGKIYYPNAFIDYLEVSKYIRFFERWLLHEVEKNIVKWKKHLSINISAPSFEDEEFIEELIEVSNAVGSNLSIEITERTLMKDIKESKRIISKLKSIKTPPMISIDDFGTGYASLSILQEFPIDIIKIDMSFVRGIHNNRKNIAIVQTVVQLAKSLGIRTIAEGVETEEEYATLRTMGVDYIQGYYFFKPMCEEKFEKIVNKRFI